MASYVHYGLIRLPKARISANGSRIMTLPAYQFPRSASNHDGEYNGTPLKTTQTATLALNTVTRWSCCAYCG